MTRIAFINGKEYYAISSSIEVDNIKTSVQIYVDVSKLNITDKHTIQKHAGLLLDRTFRIEKPKPKTKPWYQFW
jgi:hypothetical protein